MRSINVSAQERIDTHWFQRLRSLAQQVGDTFITLEPSIAKLQDQRKKFVESKYRNNPNLFPDTVDRGERMSLRGELIALKHDITEHETIPELKYLYPKKIEELVANIDMVLAANKGDIREFTKANQLIYGHPDKEIFAAECAWIRKDIASLDYPNVGQELRNKILQIIPKIDGDLSLLLPDNETFQRVKSLHFERDGYIDQLFAGVHIPENTFIDQRIGDPIVRAVIKNIGSSFELVDSPSGLWAVLQNKKQVVRPHNLSLDKKAFMGIVSHEVGSHLLEATNGAAGRLNILEQGLDRYESGNEGRAFLREQIMYDHIEDYVNQPTWKPTKASWEYRIAIHLIISLGSGLYGKKYTFAELYHLLTLLFQFWTAKRGLPIDGKVIHDGAWSMAVRALKGTDGNGGAYLKDIVYVEGNVRCWRMAQKNPEIIMFGDLGKFDIANVSHLNALKNLGILPDFNYS